MDSIPPFENASLETIAPIVSGLRAAFNTQVTKPIEFRLTQLRKLYWRYVVLTDQQCMLTVSSVSDNEKALLEALKRDIGKPVFESRLTEIDWVKNDILYMCKKLPQWIKDESVEDAPFMLKPMGLRIRKEPLGTVLIIGAYNFPVQLALGPFLGAIAAGCTAVLKPSEQAPNVAMVLGRICSVLEPSCYTCIQGGVPETSALLDQKWDKIFYTGGINVGKIIAKKAAETLTPVTLELGGKNPAIISRNADIQIAARRLVWGKAMNAGQICLSQNYHLVDRAVLPGLITEIEAALKEFFPNGLQDSPDFGRIATDRGWQRLKKLLDSTNGKILLGGKMDEATRFLELTVVQVNDTSDPLVAEEHFGPIMVLLAVDDIDHAIRIANEVDPTPLAAYPFGNKAETDKVLSRLRSGGASVNDTIFHASNPVVPFGGVGDSGQGAYRGRASFDTFTHRRSITSTPGWAERLLAARYPPYTDANLKQLSRMNKASPNFDREGNVSFSIWDYLFSRKTASLAAIIMGE
jgi:beta-apo-4'-carotenal oxygenase